eukprot:2667294-Pyramimonas_sp.AAC.1
MLRALARPLQHGARLRRIAHGAPIAIQRAASPESRSDAHVCASGTVSYTHLRAHETGAYL